MLPHVTLPKNNSGIQTPFDVFMLIVVLLILVVFMVVMVGGIHILLSGSFSLNRSPYLPSGPKALTPTQKFILAASAPTMGNNFKCVIDIWGTRTSKKGSQTAKELFEWGWGPFTYENAKNTADLLLYNVLNPKHPADWAVNQGYNHCQIQILKKLKQTYPKQGWIAWDLVRLLSVVGGAYMGGIMEYEEAAQMALEACKYLQENFSSWDDMVGNYTLGYQFWRRKKKKDRLKYYKKLKETWMYDIAWDTMLREDEL